jgi:hypothetical protein
VGGKFSGAFHFIDKADVNDWEQTSLSFSSVLVCALGGFIGLWIGDKTS